jgi:hypothetical protein
MDAVEFIRDITNKMCDRDFDLDLVGLSISPAHGREEQPREREPGRQR